MEIPQPVQESTYHSHIHSVFQHHHTQQPTFQGVPAMNNSGTYEVSPPNSCNTFMAGYLDCANEAIRYLTQDEGLSWDHPMVVELQRHLYEQQRIQYIQYLLRTASLGFCGADANQYVEGVTFKNDHTQIAQDNTGQVQYTNSCLNAIETVTKINEHEVQGNVLKDNETENEARTEPNVRTTEEREKLAADLAEEIFSLIQEGEEEFTDDEDLEDEGFEDFIESQTAII